LTLIHISHYILNRVSSNTALNGKLLSQIQVLPDDITHLCQEIHNIKRGSKHNNSIGQINKLKKLFQHLNNTPDLDWGKHGRDGLGCAKTNYNKLPSSPPINSPNNQSPSHPESSETPSAPLPPHTPSGPTARTSSLASSNTVEDPEELLTAGKASGSPDSPNKIKPSSY